MNFGNRVFLHCRCQSSPPFPSSYITCPYFDDWTDVVRTPNLHVSVMTNNVLIFSKKQYAIFMYDDQPLPCELVMCSWCYMGPIHLDYPITRANKLPINVSSFLQQMCVVKTRAWRMKMSAFIPFIFLISGHYLSLMRRLSSPAVLRNTDHQSHQDSKGEFNHICNNLTFCSLSKDSSLWGSREGGRAMFSRFT